MRIFKSLSQREYFSRDQGELPPLLRELFTRVPGEVVQPETAAEVIDIVRVANKNRTPIVARGAASTAFGQVLPVKGGIVLDLNFYKAVRKLDRGRNLLTVESGTRWSDVDAYLETRGLGLAAYPSSWYSTVGGWIATGGCGIGSLGWGSLREQVAELWVCAGDGRDLRLKPGDPNFDAFFESEGQMGVVLEVTLRVRPRPRQQRPFLIPAPDIAAAWKALGAVLGGGFSPFHAAVYNKARMGHFDDGLARKMAGKGASPPQGVRFGDSCGVLVVLENESDIARLRSWAEGKGLGVEPDFKASYIWNERFYPLKGKAHDQMFLGNEVLIPNDRAGAYCADLEALGRADGLGLAVEGEAAGKGASLVLASFFAPAADPVRYAAGLSAVFRMDRLGTRGHGGKLYHIGVYNTPFLGRKFDAARIAALKAAKARLDPKGVMNPGKFFSMTTTKTEWLPAWAHGVGARLGIFLFTLPGLRGLLARLAGSFLGKGFDPAQAKAADEKVLKAGRECVNCGFCLPVCPAFLATRDERTTARGKFFLFARAAAGTALTPEDVEMLHSCMHCGGCTAVCQSALDLVPAWDELEARVALDHGKPTRAIVDFVKTVESSEDYKRLLRKGTISEYKARV